MNRFVIVAWLTVALISPAKTNSDESPSTKWSKHTAKSGIFSAEFPGYLTVECLEHLIIGKSGDGVYFIAQVEVFKPDAEERDFAAQARSVAGSHARKSNGDVVRKTKPIMLGKMVGVAGETAVERGNWQTMRVFCDKGAIIVLDVTGKKDDPRYRDGQKFLDSFAIDVDKLHAAIEKAMPTPSRPE